MNRPRVGIVAAVARNGTIGRAGGLPWHLPDDLRHFQKLTRGHTLIMGRRTWESIGKPLKDRSIIVVSRSAAPSPGIQIVRTLTEALHLCRDLDFVWVVGGAALYAEALPIASLLELTELDADVDGDTTFPPFDRSEWTLENESTLPADEKHFCDLHFRRFIRR